MLEDDTKQDLHKSVGDEDPPSVTSSCRPSVLAQGSSRPSIVIHPPPDEQQSMACLAFAPNPYLSGFPNPQGDNLISACNSVLQLFLALPALYEEMPMFSDSVNMTAFTNMLTLLQEDCGPILDNADISWLVDPLRHQSEGHNWITHFDMILNTFSDIILDHSRFGQRFLHDLRKEPPVGSSNRSLDSNMASTMLEKQQQQQEAAKDMADSSNISLYSNVTVSNSVSHTSKFISIPLHPDSVSGHAQVPLIRLLNRAFGKVEPVFFFGGQSRSHVSLFNKEKQTDIQFTQKFHSLPHYLALSFDRKQLEQGEQSSAPIELPFDLEVGSLCCRNSSAIDHTFYKLHGFVTQSQGHFLTYTRCRGGYNWFKCDDSRVEPVDLGKCVGLDIDDKDIVYLLGE